MKQTYLLCLLRLLFQRLDTKSRWSIPGPSKGCQMVPKGCQFIVPLGLIGTLYIYMHYFLNLNTRPLCWIEQLFWNTSKHPKHRTNVVQGLLVYIHTSKHDHLNNLHLLRLCEMCFFYSSSIFKARCSIIIYVVVSKLFYFHPYLGKRSNLTNSFQMGRNHQPDMSSNKKTSLHQKRRQPTSLRRTWLHLPRLLWP